MFQAPSRPAEVQKDEFIELDGKRFYHHAEGAQSRVYIAGDEIVKVPLSIDRLREKQSAHPWHSGAVAEGKLERLYQHGIDKHREVEAYLQRGYVPRSLFADFRVDAENRTLQSRVILLDHLMAPNRPLEAESIKTSIDDFAALHLRLWGYGICETECSLFTNCGRNLHAHQLVQVDVGNVSFSYADAKRSIGRPVSTATAWGYTANRESFQDQMIPDWLAKGQVREFLRVNSELFTYYVQSMSSALTLERLDMLWPQEKRAA